MKKLRSYYKVSHMELKGQVLHPLKSKSQMSCKPLKCVRLTAAKQRFDIQLVRQVQIWLPLKNLKTIKGYWLDWHDGDVHIGGEYSTHLSVKVHK